MAMLRYKNYAQAIYSATGINVTALDIDEIPDDWMDAIIALDDVARKAGIIAKVKENGKRQSHN